MIWAGWRHRGENENGGHPRGDGRTMGLNESSGSGDDQKMNVRLKYRGQGHGSSVRPEKGESV